MIKIMKYGEVPNGEIFARGMDQINVEDIVTGILADVKENGDEALRRYCRKFDGFADEDFSLEVSEAEFEAAFEDVGPQFIGVLERAAANIRSFHEKQIRNSFLISTPEKPGIIMGQKVVPLDKVGLYVPGGTASYPSSVLMNAIPAKIAGVKEIVMVSPSKGGVINPVILAAAKIAGIDRIFKIGGAQAIAALTFGTETIPAVDKITGPGNAFVAEAKKQVYGRVAIDMIAGPSEILVVADGTCNPKYVAADMLSQAEHDKMASAVLVTDSMDLAEAVSEELERQLKRLPREEIARASIDNNGKIIVADDLHTAIEIANEIAPEHLEICVDNPFDYLEEIRHAGSVFLGKNCPEALGDYFAGPNHTLPTSGTAKFSSPLSVDDFVKKYQYSYYTRSALQQVADDVAYFAEAEGLSGHARSVTIRFEEE
ncbi:MAG: histidinol dehydrogenase [Firmicutes bacterium]|nr:histidinol dehydrogenase [Bacillota bacterium]